MTDQFTHDTPERRAILSEIELEQIVDADKTQIREAENAAVVNELTALYELETPSDSDVDGIAPITVCPAPDKPGCFWIIDGHHRYHAAVRAGKETIRVRVVAKNYGGFDVKNLDDLRFLQARENAAVTANRTIETKRRQVKAAWLARPHWTVYKISRYCSVSHDLAEAVIDELEAAGAVEAKQKPIDKAAKAIADPANAGKSNREIAKATGIAESTIRNAKKQAEQVRKTSEPKFCAPAEPVKSKPKCRLEQHQMCNYCGHWVEDYDDKGDPNEGLMEFSYNGDKLLFCDADCADDYAERHNLDVDHVNRVFHGKDFEAELQTIANKARATMQPKKPGSIALSDIDNMEAVAEDIITWLGCRAEAFAVVFNDLLETYKDNGKL